LIDDGLSTARRHDDERIATGEHGMHRLPLTVAEVGMAEALAKDGASAGLGDDLSHARGWWQEVGREGIDVR
jgi:hypothetical protein